MHTTPENPRRPRRTAHRRRRRGPDPRGPEAVPRPDRDLDSLTEVLAHQVSGRLEDLSLSDIVQMLTLGNKTACVSLYHGDALGSIWFEDGRAVHASTGDVEGEAAFYAMVGWETGRFVITNGVTASRRSLEQDAMFLVMEGTRLLEEAGSPASSIPGEAREADPPIARETPDASMSNVTGIRAAPTGTRFRRPLALALVPLLALLAVSGAWTLMAVRPEEQPPAVPSPATATLPLGWEVFLAEYLLVAVGTLTEPPSPARVASRTTAPPTSRARARRAVRVDAAPEIPVPVDAERGNVTVLLGAPPTPAAPASRPIGVMLVNAAPVIVPAQRPVPSASIELHGTNRFSAGRLIILVDGNEVYRRPLAAERPGGVFRKKKRESFAARIPVTPGDHRVIARVVDTEKGDHVGGLSLSARAGDVLQVQLTTGGVRRLQLRVD